MKQGHATGHKHERKGATDWYAEQGYEQYWIDKVTKEWAAKAQAQPQPKQAA